MQGFAKKCVAKHLNTTRSIGNCLKCISQKTVNIFMSTGGPRHMWPF